MRPARARRVDHRGQRRGLVAGCCIVVGDARGELGLGIAVGAAGPLEHASEGEVKLGALPGKQVLVHRLA